MHMVKLSKQLSACRSGLFYLWDYLCVGVIFQLFLCFHLFHSTRNMIIFFSPDLITIIQIFLI